MMSGAAVPAAAIAEAVAAARQFLRNDALGEEAVLARAAGTAFALAEAYIGLTLIVRAQEDVLAVRGGWQRLAFEPVTAIAGVTGLPIAGAPFVVPVADYAIDIDGDGVGWVSARPAVARIAIGYSAGLAADWGGLPAPIAQGIVMLIAHLFDDRASAVAPPAAVAALWRPYRRMSLRRVRA